MFRSVLKLYSLLNCYLSINKCKRTNFPPLYHQVPGRCIHITHLPYTRENHRNQKKTERPYKAQMILKLVMNELVILFIFIILNFG